MNSGNVHTSPQQLSGTHHPPFPCSSSSNILWARCVCTHWNRATPAPSKLFVPGNICIFKCVDEGSFAAVDFSRERAHTKNVCSCSAQLTDMTALRSSFCGGFVRFNFHCKMWAFACVHDSCLHIYRVACMWEFPHTYAETHFWFTARLFPAKRHNLPTNKR